jgi:lipoprotein-releasing system permease protein
MIGILKALGANNKQIARIFLVQSAAMTMRGLIFGNLLAITLCLVQKQFGLIKLNEATYYLKFVPIHLDLAHIILLNAGFFLVSMCCMILPSMLVAKFKPANTMRFA